MQSLDEETNDEENEEKLDQDYSRPFSPPSGVRDDITVDDPALDTGVDPHEWYDEGRTNATGKHDQDESS